LAVGFPLDSGVRECTNSTALVKNLP
jgi:hypothetical protein